MDHLTFAQLLGNYGEFVGAIAVVVTLVYLTAQVRQNTNAIQSSTFASWNEAAQSWGDFAAYHAKTLAIIQDKKLEDLTPEEWWVALGFATKSFNQGQAAFLHHRAGSLSSEVLDAHLEGLVQAIEGNVVLQGIWREQMRNVFAPSFVEHMEQKVRVLAPDA